MRGSLVDYVIQIWPWLSQPSSQPISAPVIPMRKALVRPTESADAVPPTSSSPFDFQTVGNPSTKNSPPCATPPNPHTPLLSQPSAIVFNCSSLQPAMALSSASNSLLRVCARQQLSSTSSRVALASCQQQQRGVADASKSSSFESPFGPSKDSTLKIPDFSKYSNKKSPRSNQVFSYFMAGTMGLASAVGAKATVQGRFCPFGCLDIFS